MHPLHFGFRNLSWLGHERGCHAQGNDREKRSLHEKRVENSTGPCYAAHLGALHMAGNLRMNLLSNSRTTLVALAIGAAVGALAFMAVAQQQHEPIGFTDTPMLPD